ncbi:MAG: zinc-dependent metalloprotease [Planctomycetota bacterium]
MSLMDWCKGLRAGGSARTSVALAAAAGTLLTMSSANALAEDSTPSEYTLTVTDADGNAVEIDPSTVGIDFSAIAASFGRPAAASSNSNKLPSWKDVSKGFERVVSTAEGRSFYDVWVNKETNQVLAELPRGFERQKHFFAMTVSGGTIFAGLQLGDLYTYWKQYGKDRVALIAPQIQVRSTGDQESKDSIEMIFTDRVLLDVPIVAKGPSGQPVIDMDALLVGQASKFFGWQASGLNRRLAEVSEAKVFPENIEMAFTVPDAQGTLKTFHYSISHIKGTPGYRPREADTRVGYFTTSYRDLGQFDWDNVDIRYINRWNLEKADKSLKLSPPKEPIVFYVEHTVPVRYRRWVREGVEYWNEAYRNIGIDGAIEVRFQDARTGAHMEKDPEDVRFNFIRWLSNDIATAIGPSRTNPMTGEILDADVILTDGWIRVYEYRWHELIPELAMEGMSPETLAWLDENPRWDPRVRAAPTAERQRLVEQGKMRRGISHFGGHPAMASKTPLMGDDEFDGLSGRVSQMQGMCLASKGKSMDLALLRAHLDVLGELAPLLAADQESMTDLRGQFGTDIDLDDLPPEMVEELKKRLEDNPELLQYLPAQYREKLEALLKAEEKEEAEESDEAAEGDEPTEEPKMAKKKKVKPDNLIDGVPESFMGPALAELVAHEVGHTIGLRHNFKASAVYDLAEINSEEFKNSGTPWSASVMDYNGVNIRMPGNDEVFGETQGAFASVNIGPYDMWAIEYGYTFGDLDKVLSRVAEPELQYATDEDTWGPDPLARRYDLSKNPLDWAKNQMVLAKTLREQLLDQYVEDGDSWARARQGYFLALGQHTRAVSAMTNWIGGTHVYRDKKGDPNGRAPLEPVPADTQREALAFAIENVFYDDAFGLDTELLRHMTVDKWWDNPGSITTEPTFEVNDRILSIQASVLTQIMNPTTLRRIYDNESYVPADQDALTLPELFEHVTKAIFEEIDNPPSRAGTDREPMISSLRRNLQREYLERLIDLTMPSSQFGAAEKPVANIANMHLRAIHGKIEDKLNGNGTKLDSYTRAHLEEAEQRIAKALEAEYIYNTNDIGGGGAPIILMLGQDGELTPAQP